MVPHSLHPDLRAICRFLLVESGPVFGIFLQKPVVFDATLGNFGWLDNRRFSEWSQKQERVGEGLVTDDGEFGAAIQGTTLFGIVGGNGLAHSISFVTHSVRINSFIYKIVINGFCAVVGKAFVVGLATLVVGVATDFNFYSLV